MTSIILTVANLVIVVALCVSIVRFWQEGMRSAGSVRRLAALSSVVTLLVSLIIYTGEFRRNALSALGYLGAGESLYRNTAQFLIHFEHVFTQIANAINGVLGAGHVGYRPYPPVWPAVLLLLGYGIRFLIYRFHTRKGNSEAALTGAVYWSHITTYAMVLSFLIVITGVSPWLLVPASLIVLGVIVVSVKLVIEDVGITVRAAIKTIWTEITRAARRIAFLATEFAAAVRSLLAYANEAYLKNVREPLRKKVEALEKRNKETREASERVLAKQNVEHGERFGSVSAISEPQSPFDAAGGHTTHTDPGSARGEWAGTSWGGGSQDPPVSRTERDETSALLATPASDDVARIADALWLAVEWSGEALNLPRYEEWRTAHGGDAPAGIHIEKSFGSIGELNGTVRRVQGADGGTRKDLEVLLRRREKGPST
jgi:hypothetical protein